VAQPQTKSIRAKYGNTTTDCPQKLDMVAQPQSKSARATHGGTTTD